ncbi:thiosulfate utilization sulfurtransferase TsuB/YeeD [Cedecea sp.]|jgi:TusA-related sulfurtransferase|uniref:thiosulfate utilization sulfurtransferase TsuB/YeeD n=1 Tax=Cedecea sp. TaxID=1970739 RepID=UPI002F42DC57
MTVKKLDVVNLVCPFPLIEAKAAMDKLNSGDELVIDFDCTQATESIPQWAAEEGHSISDYQQVGDASWSITVKKG